MATVKPMGRSKKVKKLWGLNQLPRIIVRGVAQSKSTKEVQMLIFSDNVDNGNGEKLAKFIVNNKLGIISETTPFKNPNNNHTIKGWIWTIDKKALATWFKAEPTNADYTRL